MDDEIIYSVNQKIDQALERGKSFLEDEDIQERIQHVQHIAEETVRKHPIKSVLIGLSVGFLIGKIINKED